MGIMAAGLNSPDHATATYPPLDVFEAIGSLTFTQLSELRHRGAISTVTYTFTTCCRVTRNVIATIPDISPSENGLWRWYEVGIFLILPAQLHINTR